MLGVLLTNSLDQRPLRYLGKPAESFHSSCMCLRLSDSRTRGDEEDLLPACSPLTICTDMYGSRRTEHHQFISNYGIRVVKMSNGIQNGDSPAIEAVILPC